MTVKVQENMHRVRSWYGLPGEIAVENQLWHLVEVGGVRLNHPPVVNLLLRHGLPEVDRLRLSYQHEFGHLQALPLALAHLIFLVWISRRRRQTAYEWLIWLAVLAVAHQAMWEIFAETYVMFREGSRYRQTYMRSARPLALLTLSTLACLGVGLSCWLTSPKHRPSQARMPINSHATWRIPTD